MKVDIKTLLKYVKSYKRRIKYLKYLNERFRLKFIISENNDGFLMVFN